MISRYSGRLAVSDSKAAVESVHITIFLGWMFSVIHSRACLMAMSSVPVLECSVWSLYPIEMFIAGIVNAAPTYEVLFSSDLEPSVYICR